MKRRTGADLLIHAAEKESLGGMSALARQWGIPFEESPPADGTLAEGDVVDAGAVKLEVIETPGHSPGGISLKVKDMPMVIVGDALFQFSIGRTDFPGASHAQLIKSIKDKLLTLPDDTEVYSGHGPPTLIGREKKFNPFLQEGAGGGSGIIIP